MAFATINALRESLAAPAHRTVDYAAKMLHPVPKAAVVDRIAFVLEQCKGKRVLELGASGPLHTRLATLATVFGIDRLAADGVVAFDLDDVHEETIPGDGPDLILCGETLEHLSNPGWMLTRLARQWPDVPLLVTVPNAYSAAGQAHMAQGTENVNRDHVAWYSYWTLHELLRRAGYAIETFHWYHGDPFDAEGLIVIARQREG